MDSWVILQQPRTWTPKLDHLRFLRHSEILRVWLKWGDVESRNGNVRVCVCVRVHARFNIQIYTFDSHVIATSGKRLQPAMSAFPVLFLSCARLCYEIWKKTVHFLDKKTAVNNQQSHTMTIKPASNLKVWSRHGRLESVLCEWNPMEFMLTSRFTSR